MKDLAIVVMACDQYEFLWEPWYYYFNKNWDIDLPVYFLSETKECPFRDFYPIYFNITDFGQWVRRLREGVEQIPYNNLFVLMDDFFFKENIRNLFSLLYAYFLTEDADALRILRTQSAATVKNTGFEIYGRPVQRLTQNSKYIISFIPNIWRKDFLLRCLQVNGTAWDSEVKGSKKMRNTGHRVYHYFKPDWYMGAARGGKLIKEGEDLIKQFKSETVFYGNGQPNVD